MEVNQLIKERRSIRKFSDRPVQLQRLKELLSEAEQLSQDEVPPRWRYVIAVSPDERLRLADYLMEKVVENPIAKVALSPILKSYHKHFRQVPASIIIIAQQNGNPIKDEMTYGTVCRIIQNFQLLAWDEGVGMLWMTDPILLNEAFSKNVGLRQGEKFVGILNIGYPEKIPKGRPRTPAEKRWTVIS
ncbi:nitroreductase family protein [Paenibacillus sp. MER 99-2]|uniref:nitroreductase family protein n=1 Tax=Paenibacillus sp. MER 99-2 TaxID=2939572 RepID=UPI00203F4B6A|nr:nitroreductase family protein [Paenibacillus sp. MER 99-2]MCM3172328.1 nitroreductase family protein [Paenibacillus sp. MER 99-2]